MAVLIRNTTTTRYHVDEDRLLHHLVTVDNGPMALKCIHGSNAIFESYMKYPIELKHSAMYTVTVTANVPLTRFQHSNDQVTHIYSSTVQNFITFRFNNFVNSNGYLVYSIS